MTLLLARHEVEQCLSLPELIDVLEGGFRLLAGGEPGASFQMPQRLVMPVGEGGHLLAMPAHVDTALSVKLIGVFPGNPRQGLPTSFALVVLFDAHTGRPLAILDGESLTAGRTGAASGVATRWLARPEARVLAVLGSGRQAITQIRAVCAVRPIEEIRVWSPHFQGRVAEFAALVGRPVTAPPSAEAAVRGADIVVLATSSRSPVLEAAWLSPGAHVNAVGAFRPDSREADSATVAGARVFCDSVEACLAEGGDVVIPLNEGALTKEDLHGLGDLILGRVEGRRAAGERTFFKSVGLAFQDALAAELSYGRAREKGLGTPFEL